ncbi:MAG: PorT family protein [Bacteroidales bacterium]|jgi:hypothetical protein|nr:PorT family protein [Bacteroidales bacterium]
MKTHFECLLLGVFLQAISIMGFSQFTFGPKVSLNFSNIPKVTYMEPGFNAGFFFRIGKNFYFQPEINYSFRSSTLKGVMSELKEKARLKNHYLDIPLLVGYKFINNPNFNFRISIGPRVGVLIANNTRPRGKDNPIGRVQIGGRSGIGIDFWRFTFDVNYDFSASKDKVSTNKWYKQNMLDISLGFKILKN